jgi:RimJ/RimL family protein N-acetyltransferase
MKLILETDRLFLREFIDSDYDDLCEILQDKDVMYAYEHPFSEDEVKGWYNKLIAGHYEKYGFGLWAVIHKETNDFLGHAV